MRRREFITLVGGVSVWPLAARAQQSKLPVIGVLSNADKPQSYIGAFQAGLREIGFVEGQNVAIEYRNANNQIDRLPALASELVRKQVAVVAALSTASGLAAKAATSTIPVVFVGGADPAKFGFTGDLNRPGGNLTGVTFLEEATAAKRLELLHEIAPKAVRIGLLVNPTVPTDYDTKEGLNAARVLGLELRVFNASNEREIDAAFATLSQWQAGGLLIAGGNYFTVQSHRLANLTLTHKVPAIFNVRDFPAAGGLMSYGGDPVDAYRIVGNYIGRILKGGKPADLPVQQTTKVELIINMKTAKAFGLTVPLSLLGRADEVIE
jgi:putative tryptophan/tyrosine transport system substrate-binding protein